MGRFETRLWEADPNAHGTRAARRSVRIRVYIPDRIADQPPLASGMLSGQVSSAERAVQALQARASKHHLQALSLWLLRTESIGSSWIEGHRMSQRRLARAEAEAPESRDETAKAVLGNIRAMERLVRLASDRKPLMLGCLLKAHADLMQETPDPRGAGTLRTVQNWIGGRGATPADATFIPPPPEYVRPLVEDLLRFVARCDQSPVLQAAIAHAQFEAIHPFSDGNGRLGRTLLQYVMRRSDLARNFVPPVSLVLATHKDAYIAGLNGYAGGHLDEWAALFCWATERASVRSIAVIDEVEKLQASWRERAGRPRRDSAAEGLIAGLPGQPVVTVEMAAQLTGRSIQAANSALNGLQAAGVLRNVSAGRWRRAFEASEVLELFNGFERDMATLDGAIRPVRPAPAPQRRP